MVDEVVRQVNAAVSPVWLGDVDPVHEVGVLQTGAAGDVHAIAVVTLVGLRQEGEDGPVVAADRQLVEDSRRELGADGRGHRVDAGPVGRDHEGSQLGRLLLQLKVSERARLAEWYGNPLDDEGPIPDTGESDREGTRGQGAQPERAPSVRDRPPVALEVGTRDGDLNVAQRLASGAEDAALDVAGGLLGAGAGCREQRHH